jgi:ribosomal protein S18 acetylase RimI-like enzyme
VIKMLIIRPAQWPDDIALLDGLDTSFTTDRIYRVIRDEFSFTLVEERVDPPLQKSYGSIASHEGDIRAMEYAAVAEDDGVVAGFAAARHESWNRRVVMQHLYVAAGRRRSDVGRALINQLDALARAAGARCLCTETQNINYPAIQFYRHLGFRLCGLDESLYDSAGLARDEIALFLARELG